jgi:hypothetical protein
MRATVECVTQEQIQSADVILALSRSGDSRTLEVFRRETIARGRAAGTGPYEVRILEVEVDLADGEQIDSLRRKVESATGKPPKPYRSG